MRRTDARRFPPQEQLDSVIRAIYADADRLGWRHMPLQQKTAQYDQWVSDPDVGGVLTDYMSSENARSWIKDGPMKEYARARQGAGRYAQFGSTQGPTAEQVAAHAFGGEAVVVGGSVGVKPFHCVATNSNGASVYVAWGESKNFRYLVWACLGYLAEKNSARASIVVVDTMAEPATAAEKTRHAAIASRCSIDLKYYRAESRKRLGRSETGAPT
jgi:hypothetical protein